MQQPYKGRDLDEKEYSYTDRSYDRGTFHDVNNNNDLNNPSNTKDYKKGYSRDKKYYNLERLDENLKQDINRKNNIKRILNKTTERKINAEQNNKMAQIVYNSSRKSDIYRKSRNNFFPNVQRGSIRSLNNEFTNEQTNLHNTSINDKELMNQNYIEEDDHNKMNNSVQ